MTGHRKLKSICFFIRLYFKFANLITLPQIQKEHSQHNREVAIDGTYKGEIKLKYIEHQFNELEPLMDKHEKTLEERSSQKTFCSELHRLLDTKYIVYHLEFVEFKGSTE